MKRPGSVSALEDLGRVRLSENFFMRETPAIVIDPSFLGALAPGFRMSRRIGLHPRDAWEKGRAAGRDPVRPDNALPPYRLAAAVAAAFNLAAQETAANRAEYGAKGAVAAAVNGAAQQRTGARTDY